MTKRETPGVEVLAVEHRSGPFYTVATNEHGADVVKVEVMHPRWTITGVTFRQDKESGDFSLAIADDLRGEVGVTFPAEVVEFALRQFGFEKPTE